MHNFINYFFYFYFYFFDVMLFFVVDALSILINKFSVMSGRFLG